MKPAAGMRDTSHPTGTYAAVFLAYLYLESTRSGIRPASSSPSVVVIYTSTTHPAVSSVNHWPSIVSCCCIHLLEHSSSRCSIFTFRLNFSATATFPLLTVWVYLHSNFCGGPKHAKSREIPREFNLTAVQGHPRIIDLGVNQKPICDFLLVINSNFGRIWYRFRDIDA